MCKRVFIAIACLLFMVFLVITCSMPIFYRYGKQVKVYINSNSSLCQETLGIKLLQAGKMGESFSFNKGEIDIEKILSDFEAEILFVESIKEGQSLYAYSKKIPYYKTISGRRINLHLFVTKELVKVGTPLIFGSF